MEDEPVQRLEIERVHSVKWVKVLITTAADDTLIFCLIF